MPWSNPDLSEDDPRLQPDAYISHGGHLYEVIGLEKTGPQSGKVHVRNCSTEHLLWMAPSEVAEAKLEKAAPPPVTIPDEWAHPAGAITARDVLDAQRPGGAA